MSAREDLAAVVGTPLLASTPPIGAGSPRRAAVLMLFGVLDRVSASRPADASAVPADLDVLLLARSAELRAHPGEVAFPGGRVDHGDTDATFTALREAREETGVDAAGVEVLGELPAVPLEHSNHLVTPVLAWWRSPEPVRVVDERESASVFRVPVVDLLDPARRGVTVLRRGAREFRGPAFEIDDGERTHTLWGFTAMLLDGLFDRVGWTEPWDREREVPLQLIRD